MQVYPTESYISLFGIVFTEYYFSEHPMTQGPPQGDHTDPLTESLHLAQKYSKGL